MVAPEEGEEERDPGPGRFEREGSVEKKEAAARGRPQRLEVVKAVGLEGHSKS